MMRRRAMPMRRGPGLLGAMATTAVVAGTATAVSRGVAGHMDSKAQAQQQEQMAEQAALQNQADMQQMQAQMEAMQAQQAQMAAQQVAQPPPAPAPAAAPAAAAPAAPDLMAQLQQLAQLKESGVLSDEEFQAAKAKLLAS
jgi:hypothetical protein